MQTVNLFHAKTHLSKLIEQIATGEESEIIVARNGKPVARILPITQPDTSRRIGIAKDEFVVPEDIDQTNDEITRLFAEGPPTDAPDYA